VSRATVPLHGSPSSPAPATAGLRGARRVETCGAVEQGGSRDRNVMVVVERQFDYPRPALFRAWTVSEEMTRWRGGPGGHVETDTATCELRVGGPLHHVKVREDEPAVRVTTEPSSLNSSNQMSWSRVSGSRATPTSNGTSP
jgi:hypothetical protein